MQLTPSIPGTSFHRFYYRIRRVCSSRKGKLCCAARGNLLEAVNLALNRYDRSNINADLRLFGRSIVIMTASSGAFEVGRDLSAITELRMKRTGMGCDLVCMAEPPLHAVPLFVLRENKMYDVPHWAHVSFFRSYSESSSYDQIVGVEKKEDETKTAQAIMSAVSIFGSSKGGLHREKYSKLLATTRLSRILWPIPFSRRDLPISRRIDQHETNSRNTHSPLLEVTVSTPSFQKTRKTQGSPLSKMISRNTNSFPSPPVRLSKAFDGS